jgi:apolipoprotein N-acyltransferase
MSAMKKLHPFLLSALTGLLLYAAWPESPLTPLIFIAFVPLLWLERQGLRAGRFFGWTYLSMLIWSIGATWWIWNSTVPPGSFFIGSIKEWATLSAIAHW